MKVNVGDPKVNTPRRELMHLDLYRGIYSRVARRLGVDRSMVSRVARGQKTSKRVEKALRSELRRIDRLARKLAGKAA